MAVPSIKRDFRGREGRRESLGYQLAIYAVLIVGGLPIVMPIYWLLLASLKTNERMNATPPDWVPIDKRDFVAIAGQEMRVSIFDDGSMSGTGVARVKLVRDQPPLRLPAERIERGTEVRWFAEIDGRRRRVEPVGGEGSGIGDRGPGGEHRRPAGAGGEEETERRRDGVIEVALPGTMRQVEAPIDAVEVVEREVAVWSVLGVEIPVEIVDAPTDGDDRSQSGLPKAATVRIRWLGDSPAVRVRPDIVHAEAGGELHWVRVSWSGRDIPAESLLEDEGGGYWTVRLRAGEGLEVPWREIRREERIERFATVDGERQPVRVLRRDADRGVAIVELLHQPQTRRVEASRVERVERSVYTAEILGERQVVEPLAPIEFSTAADSGEGDQPTSGPLPYGRGSAGGVDSTSVGSTSRPALNGGSAPGSDNPKSKIQNPKSTAAAPRSPIPDPTIPVHVPGAIAVAADRIRTEAPLAPQWSNYAAAWAEQEFDLYIVNTLFIAALVVLGTVISCGLVGYAFARYEFRGRNLLFLLLLSTMMVPAQVTAIPTFVLFAKFGWIDSFKPLIVPHFLAYSAFFVFLFRQFMLTIPADLEDSARIDGCGPLQTWWLIMMPLCRPIVITVAVFSFIGVWNDFLYPLLYINSDEKQTVALGLQSFKSAYAGAEPQLIMAASVMMIIPTVLLFFVAQKAFMRGVVVSGVKG